MKRPPKDRDLGMGRRIPRRDFMQGALAGAALTLTGSLRRAYAAGGTAPQDEPGYYPPLLNGLRGSHPGSFEAAHALRDGTAPGAPQTLDETYDLVVVGGGISGLAAAHFYREKFGPKARILVLDNHDDFGGHAKRNEFSLNGRMHLMNGGTLSIESPRPYSATAEGLLRAIGIDLDPLIKESQHQDFYRRRGLTESVFFDKETFGTDKLVTGRRSNPAAIAHYPLSARARQDVLRIEGGTEDFMPGSSPAEKKDRLSRMSYRDFLLNVVHADPSVVPLYQAITHGWWGVGIDAVSALDCWGNGFSGFKGLQLPPGSIARMGYTPAGFADTGGSKDLHFPDGNASVARLLVRSLVPDALPGRTAEDAILARLDYSRLDRAGAPARIRLSSVVVRARNLEGGTEVVYMRGGSPYAVRARHCVMASWNMMIPYICPEMPATQRSAMHELVKCPLVYTTVALRNWQAFEKLKIQSVYAPGSYHTNLSLNWKVDFGEYRSVEDPAEPILLHMQKVPCKPGLTEHEQNKVGRAELLATPFETFERNIRDQLGRVLSSGGFDPARDITAIAVNRWPHGYAPEYNPLFDPLEERDRPQGKARAPFGHITIANSDCGGGAYTDVAMDQAHRAVNELPA